MTGGELAIVIAGRREDWPRGARTLTPREPTREPNGTLWFGADLDPDGSQVWFRITATGRRPDAGEDTRDHARGERDPWIRAYSGALSPPRRLARRTGAR